MSAEPKFMPVRDPAWSDEEYAEVVNRAAEAQAERAQNASPQKQQYAPVRLCYEDAEPVQNRENGGRRVFMTVNSDGSSEAAPLDE